MVAHAGQLNAILLGQGEDAEELRRLGVETRTGRFGAKMSVDLVNDGPVTIVITSADLDRPRRG